MCGIAGTIALDANGVDADEVRRMMAALAHRGPDGDGLEIRRGCVLGHRRLSIIDLEGGHQPLSNEDGTVWVTFNGEIYNFPELRQQLEGLGHRFRTRTDTEVLVHGWEEWREECVKRLRGMFAFALWDERDGVAFLARDRLGIKPLVYWQHGGRLYFASELQAFQALFVAPTAIDPESLDWYLELGYIPAPATVFQGVFKLPPAHTLTVRSGGAITVDRYWKLAIAPEEDVPTDEWVERLDDALRDSIRRHLLSDVPVGSFLSGGVDSSIVTAAMARFSKDRVRTFSVSVPDPEYDEAPRARITARRLGTIHEEVTLAVDTDAVLRRLALHCGEPFADSSIIPTYVVSGLAAKELKVVLSGDGGDEASVGYPWLMGVLQDFVLPAYSLRGRAKSWLRPLWRRARGRSGSSDPVATQAQARALFNNEARRELWGDMRASRFAHRPTLCDRSYADVARLDVCERVQWLDYEWYLPGDILMKVDVASMCHGLEVRVPLIDHEFVEVAARIPWRRKVARRPDGTLESKRVLRRVGRRYVEADRLDGRKMGFALPLNRRPPSTERNPLRQQLTAPGVVLAEVFERRGLERILGAYEPDGSGGQKVWALRAMDVWLQEHPRAKVAW